MNLIVEMKFGSHLYGTATPQSDLDYKAVYLPSKREILLSRAKSVITLNTKSDTYAKNGSDDIDREIFSLQRYLSLAAEGQTVALDMLFAPENMVERLDDVWSEIQASRSKLLSSKSKSFVGYVKTQANKYGIKGSRMSAALAAQQFFEVAVEKKGTQAKVGDMGDYVMDLVDGYEHMEIIPRTMPGDVVVNHLSVCGRQVPFTASLKTALDIYATLYRDYGERSRKAMANEGIDWKALSHAVRVGHQAIELLTCHRFTFPRPEAEHLVKIKTGQLSYQTVAEEIEQLLVDVEEAAATSALPAQADVGWIDDFVAKKHLEVVTLR